MNEKTGAKSPGRDFLSTIGKDDVDYGFPKVEIGRVNVKVLLAGQGG